MPVLITALVYLCLAARRAGGAGQTRLPGGQGAGRGGLLRAGAGVCPAAGGQPLADAAAGGLCALAPRGMWPWVCTTCTAAPGRCGGAACWFAAGHLCFIAGLWRTHPGPRSGALCSPCWPRPCWRWLCAGACWDMGRLGRHGRGLLLCRQPDGRPGYRPGPSRAPGPGTLLFAAGGVLFWASDLILLGLYFSRKKGSAVAACGQSGQLLRRDAADGAEHGRRRPAVLKPPAAPDPARARRGFLQARFCSAARRRDP